MKIGILGGAFNPVHFGHIRAAGNVLRILSLDKIIFVPAGNPPFKKPGLAEAMHRFEMVKAALIDFPDFEVSDVEIMGEGKSYTVDTIEKLSSASSELFLITGIDAFRDMPLWKEPRRLMSIANIVVISRPGHSFAGLSNSPYVSGVSVDLLNELDSGKRLLFSIPTSEGRQLFLCGIAGVDISSSMIREAVRNGEDTKYLLPESVKSYIILHNLYTRDDS
ncbi:MAG: nicotinate (nicotinamide) nucleotide adenylyltransferase [Nitrospirae bacterium]|nr:nicotinate (nicotinamide) nucleotide adenylyltransferase [Nitrospirota bacterium]